MQEVRLGHVSSRDPFLAVLGYLVDDVLGAEQPEQSRIRPVDQDGSPVVTAGREDVIPQPVGIRNDRRDDGEQVTREGHRGWSGT